MDKILVISNVRCSELGKFIEQRGTFKVAGCYNSLSENVVDIQNRIFEVAKTIYLYQPEEGATNIRADMQVLQTMIKGNSFFKPGEIVFMTRTSPQCRQAERYFVSVMDECRKQDYSIKRMDGAISFSDVYDNLMGISASDDFKNTYKTYYRAERNSESSVVYEGQDDSDLIIEPYSFANLNDYNKQKELLVNMSSSVLYKDDDVDGIKQYARPNLGQLKVRDVFGCGKVVLMSGKPKSGLSTWAAAISVSSTKDGNSTLVLDFTSNSDVGHHLREAGIDFHDCPMKDILQNRAQPDGLNICTYLNEREFAVRLNFLKNIFSHGILRYDVVLIPVDYRDFERVLKLLGNETDKIFLTVVPRYSDVLELLDYAELVEGMKVVAFMNESIRGSSEGMVGQEEVKEILGVLHAKVVKNCWFTSLNIGTNLSRALLG